VLSNREQFQVELRSARGGLCRKMLNNTEETPETDVDENDTIFGSLMATGKRDKFGRDVHMKVCHLDTLRYNKRVAEIRSAITKGNCLVDQDAGEELVPSESQEVLLRDRREEEINRIREVLLRSPGETPRPAPVLDSALALSGDVENRDVRTSGTSQQWRGIEDHEARWQFLEETCFFGHNLGYKKIKKQYPKEDILDGSANPEGCDDNCQGFGATKYLRKYIVSNNSENYITHEADPMFHKPLENFLGFLCEEEHEENRVTVPFYVLPFPGCFTALSLDNYVNDANLVRIELEGDPDEHRQQRVSDYSLPTGNNFLNDPISYNKFIANVSLPVKLNV